ncbi:hypothetical protein AWC38_SpisGene14698 [Stylophora pistillata]|uniref:Uncharacterized protein n=1 Tax=Stylophora pistillata TaxID=50429 RepID=A0A2B4RQV4_STYPI|nr:hypothetical protein AWC38_SpisGene14698 [Stylophora pistillata]
MENLDASFIISDIQLSLVCREAKNIPETIGKKYGKVVKILDLSSNELSVVIIVNGDDDSADDCDLNDANDNDDDENSVALDDDESSNARKRGNIKIHSAAQCYKGSR